MSEPILCHSEYRKVETRWLLFPAASHFEKNFQQMWIEESTILIHDRQRFLGSAAR
jgi:hypothetical protein